MTSSFSICRKSFIFSFILMLRCFKTLASKVKIFPRFLSAFYFEVMLVSSILNSLLYTPEFQDHLTIANYWNGRLSQRCRFDYHYHQGPLLTNQTRLIYPFSQAQSKWDVAVMEVKSETLILGEPIMIWQYTVHQMFHLYKWHESKLFKTVMYIISLINWTN